jgi:RluA family pseudouridine synthase
MEKTLTFTVPVDDQGLSLLSFLKKEIGKERSVKSIKRAIDAKCCEINGCVEYFSTHRLKTHDCVRLRLLSEKKRTLSILYEDPYFLICNKDGQTVSDIASLAPLLPRSYNLHLVHRLDKETSGAIILAKTDASKEAFETLFRERKIEKKYLAIVDKKVDFERKSIKTLLTKVHYFQGMSLYGSNPEKGKLALTEILTLKRGEMASLLQCNPKTGRTHQIRVHLSEIGHPILGDYLYGANNLIYRPTRHLLHASSLAFIHPVSQQEICIEAPLPADFLQAMKVLQCNVF